MNYADAAIRHYKDADKLYFDKRYDNSDQLFGLAAECALKKCLSRRCFTNGNLDDRFWIHINSLWDRIKVHIDSKTYPSILTIIASKDNPFSNWNINQRYESTAFINEAICNNHRNWTKRIIGAAGLLGARS